MRGTTLTPDVTNDPLHVSLPRFLLLGTSIMLLVGLGALAASGVTGRAACLDTFFRGPGALFLVTLAFFQFSLARMVVRQFLEGEVLRPAWFLIMLSGGCHLTAALCLQILSVASPVNPLAYGMGAWAGIQPSDLQRFGLLVGGPVELLLLAAGMAFVVRACLRSNMTVSFGGIDWVFLLMAAADAYFEIRQLAGSAVTTYDLLMASSGPALALLIIEANLVRRSIAAFQGGLIAKCWNSLAAAILLTAIANLGTWLAHYGYLAPSLTGITWHIGLLASTAYAIAPAWQIEAIQSACGEIGVSRFSPVASSLAALRLLHRSRY